ncbi:MAG: chemotaxis protein CheX [Planctomycetota bacterium]
MTTELPWRVLSTDECLDALVRAAGEVCARALGFGGALLKRKRSEIHEGLCGAYIALVSDDVALALGVTSSREGCLNLAQALLGMEHDKRLSPGDVADAVGEIANILAGSVKRLLSNGHPSFKIGLPIFIDGTLYPSENQEAAVAEVDLGPVSSELLVVRHKPVRRERRP